MFVNVFRRTARKYEYKLNDTDDQIIEYIMSNKRLVVSLSIQSLAASLYTVPNTITRLSKKLGYDGFSQLKNSLKDELETELEGHGELEGDLHATVQKTLQLIDMDKIEMVSKVLRDAKKILVYGVGDTVPFCEMLVKNLKVTGKQTEFYIHPHEIRHGIEELKSKDVLFLISLSGETDQVLKMAELGKDRLITIISLTHFNANALQKLADINLYCHAPKKVLNGYNVTDKTSLVIVLRVLSEYIWNEAG